MTDIPLDGWIDKARVDLVLSQIKPGDRLVINSRGGDLLESRRLADHIRKNNIDTHVFSTGMAHSAATLVFAAGNKRSAGKNAQFMIHPGQPLKPGGVTIPDANAFYLNSLVEFGVKGSEDFLRAQRENVVWDHAAALGHNLINHEERMARILGPLE